MGVKSFLIFTMNIFLIRGGVNDNDGDVTTMGTVNDGDNDGDYRIGIFREIRQQMSYCCQAIRPFSIQRFINAMPLSA